MTRFRQMLYIIVAGLVTAGVLTGYYLWHRTYVQPLSCGPIWYSTIRMRR